MIQDSDYDKYRRIGSPSCSEEALFELWSTLPNTTKYNREQFDGVMIIWAGIVLDELSSVTNDADYTRQRELFNEVANASSRLSKSIARLSRPDGNNDAGPALQLSRQLAPISAQVNDVHDISLIVDMLENASLRASSEAGAKISNASEVVRRTLEIKTGAVSMLARIWCKDRDTVVFGRPFKSFAANALLMLYDMDGENEARLNLDKITKNVISRFRANPSDFRLGWLPNF